MKGFTMLELVIASLLAALIGTATVVVVGRATAASGRTQDGLRQLRLLEKTSEKLGRELRNAVALADPRFAGASTEISFATSAGSGELARVGYRIEPTPAGRVLVREWQPLVPDPPPVQKSVLVPEGVDFSILYGMMRETELLPSLIWAERWGNPLTEPAAVPQVVRVRLGSKDRKGKLYTITREFLIPQGVLKESTT